MVPYTFTIQPEILELRPGYARITIKDRRSVRNHLKSIHAIALTNLGEVTSGLAVLTAVPDTHQSILKSLSIEFLKKARGRLVAESQAPENLKITDENEPTTVIAQIFDADRNVVARLTASWVVGPKRKK